MWLVFCDAMDAAALWAYQGLQQRGLTPLELVSSAMLACSLRWDHLLPEGQAHIEITLADGRRIRGEHTQGVLNRLTSIPLGHWRSATPKDRDYVEQEMFAFCLSWLHAFPCPVLNRPTPQGLSGAWRSESEWVWLAAQAGLPVSPYEEVSNNPLLSATDARRLLPSPEPLKTVMVVAGVPTGAQAPAPVRAGCRRLADLSQTAILGIEFAAGAAGPWTFAGATPMPDLRLGGAALLDALVLALMQTRKPV